MKSPMSVHDREYSLATDSWRSTLLPQHQQFFALPIRIRTRHIGEEELEPATKSLDQFITSCPERRAGLGLDVVKHTEKQAMAFQHCGSSFHVLIPKTGIDRAETGVLEHPVEFAVPFLRRAQEVAHHVIDLQGILQRK